MSTYKELLKRLETLAKKLDSMEGVLVEGFEIRPPVSEQKLQQIIEEAKNEDKIILHQDFIDFYKECDGIELVWTFDFLVGDYSEIGSTRIQPISSFLGSWKDFLYFDWEDDESGEANIRDGYDLTRCKAFDLFIEEACNIVFFPENKPEYEILYHYCGEEIIPTKWNLQQYLDNLIKAKALWYWSEKLATGTLEEFFDEIREDEFYAVAKEEGAENIFEEVLKLEI